MKPERLVGYIKDFRGTTDPVTVSSHRFFLVLALFSLSLQTKSHCIFHLVIQTTSLFLSSVHSFLITDTNPSLLPPLSVIYYNYYFKTVSKFNFLKVLSF